MKYPCADCGKKAVIGVPRPANIAGVETTERVWLCSACAVADMRKEAAKAKVAR